MGCSASAVAAREAAETANSFHANYSLEKIIGSGSYGVVYKAHPRHSDHDRTLAVKILPKNSPKRSSAAIVKKRFQSEVDMLKRCQGTHVIRLNQVFQNRDFCYAVMEHGHCTVLQALVTAKQATEFHLARILAGMIEGIAHCHKMKVVHRDIKPQNFLLTEDGNIADNRFKVKLSDFGMAKIVPDGFDFLNDVCGTCPFVAPEMLQGAGYNYKVDIWSLGVTAYLMFFGSFPYKVNYYKPRSQDRADLRKMIRDGETKISFSSANNLEQPSQEAVAFVQKLLERDPQSRPTAASVLLMPFVLLHRETHGQSHGKALKGQTCYVPESWKRNIPTERLARLFAESMEGQDSDTSEKTLTREKLEEGLHKLVLQADNRYGTAAVSSGLPVVDFEQKSDRCISDVSTEASSTRSGSKASNGSSRSTHSNRLIEYQEASTEPSRISTWERLQVSTLRGEQGKHITDYGAAYLTSCPENGILIEIANSQEAPMDPSGERHGEIYNHITDGLL
eukprot:gnl/MRDRNA2_/MRDRNA2_83829_c0_seq2.p1 gnl/MRDRNA2_/MRDRNA2_83829_c0~~gnl/MRDRNA2_/MRDRNA2_83829_c0_seq2.p1  ORF type:complete len:507 (-),score=64.35 gnl/MRDRNA2_/MRDRNA2_83829_c0_seq2:54-1574(-)